MYRALHSAVVMLLGVACSTDSERAPATAGSGSGAEAAAAGASGSASGGSSSSGASGADGQAGSGGSAGGSGGGSPAAGGSSAGAGLGGGGGGGGGGGAAHRCDPALSAANKASVNAGLDALFVARDIAAIDQYWAEPYLQHNPIAASGVEAFRDVMSGIVGSPSFSYQRLRSLAECDLVVVQGRYSGTGVIFDMFRVEDGKLVEHWDSDANQASSADGPSEITDLEQTAANRALVLAYLEGADSQLLAADYVDHRTVTGAVTSYDEIHHVIADGNFVFTLSEGRLNGTAYGFYDLFRVQDGKLAEHWDSRRVVPATTASGLGIF